MDKILKQRVYNSVYWKTECFNINAAIICDKAAELECIGGTDASNRPTPFLCLVEKLILIDPGREIIEEYLDQPHLKYLTALALFYVRLMYKKEQALEMLEPFLEDWRKLRVDRGKGVIELTTIDQFTDELMTEKRGLGVLLPR